MGALALLHGLGTSLLSIFVELSIEWAVLVAVMTAGLRIRSAKVRHLLWLLVLIKPLTTLWISSPFTVYHLLPAAPHSVRSPVIRDTPASSSSDASTRIAKSQDTPELTPATVLGAVWLGGFGLLLMRLVAGFGANWHLRSVSPQVHGGPIHEALVEAQGRIGVTPGVSLAITEHGQTPVVSGMLRPLVVLPRSLGDQLARRELSLLVGAVCISCLPAATGRGPTMGAALDGADAPTAGRRAFYYYGTPALDAVTTNVRGTHAQRFVVMSVQLKIADTLTQRGDLTVEETGRIDEAMSHHVGFTKSCILKMLRSATIDDLENHLDDLTLDLRDTLEEQVVGRNVRDALPGRSLSLEEVMVTSLVIQ